MYNAQPGQHTVPCTYLTYIIPPQLKAPDTWKGEEGLDYSTDNQSTGAVCCYYSDPIRISDWGNPWVLCYLELHALTVWANSWMGFKGSIPFIFAL